MVPLKLTLRAAATLHIDVVIRKAIRRCSAVCDAVFLVAPEPALPKRDIIRPRDALISPRHCADEVVAVN